MSEAKTSAQVTRGADRPEQLTLLGSSSVSARFKLSRDTRERGLRHIAEIRQLLAAATTTSEPPEIDQPALGDSPRTASQ